jgi:uncharacterized SAM-binding protein YcdF (DUF218 family)
MVPREGRVLAAGVGVVLFAFIGGFIIFASSISHYTPREGVGADGIVVVTGGVHRLSEASRLLSAGRGKRLLVSGVNRIVTAEDLHRASGLSEELFNKQVDIGYQALDTVGNADETKAWAKANGFRRLIIVTSSYHMPRTLTELGRAMPRATLIPYPVVSRNFRTERWWMHARTARLLFFEYMKFLPSAARYGLARLISTWDGSAFAHGDVDVRPYHS